MKILSEEEEEEAPSGSSECHFGLEVLCGLMWRFVEGD